MTKRDSCYLDTWEESDVDGKKLYIFGMQPEMEAVKK
jgi:hypothetical protein